MSFGPSAAEREAQQYRQQFSQQLPQYMNQGMNWTNQGLSQLTGLNGEIRNYISGIGQDPTSQSMSSYLSGIMNGSTKAANGAASLVGPMAQGSASQGNASTATAAQASAFDLAMRGQGFAQQFGSDLGGLAMQQKNMQTVADKLSSTTDNPFAVLTKQAMEDAAFQNMQGRDQLSSQLASQGLGSQSGVGAAALAALQFNTNKQVADAGRQNAVQGAQFQQQGLGMAGGLYGQLAGLDLQRATTAGQLGLQGYQADLQNASRYDAVNMANAQMQTQTSNNNAGLLTQASLQNAQLATQASLQNAQMQNAGTLQNAQLQTQASLTNAGYQNDLVRSAMQGQLGMMQTQAGQQAALYGLMSQNAGQYIGAGQNMWGAGFSGQQNYMNMMNQMAQANAAGRGNMWGGLLQGGLGLAGTLFGGPIGGMIGSSIGGMLGNGFRGDMYSSQPFTGRY